MSHTHTVSVPLGDRSYDIVIGDDLLSNGKAAHYVMQAAHATAICVVTHPILVPACASPLVESLRKEGQNVSLVMLPPGERTKNLAAVNRLYSAFLDAGLDRKSQVVSVGGGVLGDLAGFAAATYLRGISFVNVPTTLLAQVDASVGGKTGVDLPQGKNLVGAFHQPSCVIIDTGTLRSLPARELRAGLAEVIKYGIISDEAFFRSIQASMPALLKRDSDALHHAVTRSCEIKAGVVARDETEQGVRAILNFGHTVGHAIEALTGYRRYKHGEAISIGMITESLIGEEMGVTPPHVTRSLVKLLELARLPVDFPADITAEQVLASAQRDKKTIGGRMHIVLAQSIGSVLVSGNAAPAQLIAAVARHREMKRAAR